MPELPAALSPESIGYNRSNSVFVPAFGVPPFGEQPFGSLVTGLNNWYYLPVFGGPAFGCSTFAGLFFGGFVPPVPPVRTQKKGRQNRLDWQGSPETLAIEMTILAWLNR
jgi:hypothetical protein